MVKVTEVYRKAFAGEMLDPSEKVVPDIYYRGLFNQTLDPSISEAEYIPPVPKSFQKIFSIDQLNPRSRKQITEKPDMSHFTPQEQVTYKDHISDLAERVKKILDSHRVDSAGKNVVDVDEWNDEGEHVFRSPSIDPYILDTLRATQKVLEKTLR